MNWQITSLSMIAMIRSAKSASPLGIWRTGTKPTSFARVQIATFPCCGACADSGGAH